MQYNNSTYRTITINEKAIPELKIFIKEKLLNNFDFPKFSTGIIQTLNSIKFIKQQNDEYIFCYLESMVNIKSIIIGIINIDGISYTDLYFWNIDNQFTNLELIIQLINDSQTITLLDWINQN